MKRRTSLGSFLGDHDLSDAESSLREYGIATLSDIEGMSAADLVAMGLPIAKLLYECVIAPLGGLVLGGCCDRRCTLWLCYLRRGNWLGISRPSRRLHTLSRSRVAYQKI